jgi:uncharacterized protein
MFLAPATLLLLSFSCVAPFYTISLFSIFEKTFNLGKIPYMKPVYLIILILFIIVSCNDNKKESVAPSVAVNKYDFTTDTSVYSNEMKRYWLVLLKKGDNRNQDSISAAKIQTAHLANINRLVKEGKIIMAGPMGTDGDLRGIFIMNCSDSTEIERIVNTDSAVITGRLKMEYYPWWSAKGKFIFK